MAACANCGKENPPGLKFCVFCGKPLLSEPPVPPAVAAGRTCPACGASIPEAVKYCIKCGKPLGVAAQPPVIASPPAPPPLSPAPPPPPPLQPPVLPPVGSVVLPPPPLAMPPGPALQPRKSPVGKTVTALAVIAVLGGGGYYGYTKWHATKATPEAVVQVPPQGVQSAASTAGSQANLPPPAQPSLDNQAPSRTPTNKPPTITPLPPQRSQSPPPTFVPPAPISAPATARVVGTPVLSVFPLASGSCPATPPPATTTFLSTEQTRINLWISLTGLSNGDKISFALTDPTGKVNHTYDYSMDVVFDQGYLGITERDITSDRAKGLNLPAKSGAEVTRVYEDTPAERAGLKAGDIVLDYNGQRVEEKDQLNSLIRGTPPGREARLGIWRGGSILTLTVDIQQRTRGGESFCYHPVKLNTATAMPGNWSVSAYWNNQPTPLFPPLAFTIIRVRP